MPRFSFIFLGFIPILSEYTRHFTHNLPVALLNSPPFRDPQVMSDFALNFVANRDVGALSKSEYRRLMIGGQIMRDPGEDGIVWVGRIWTDSKNIVRHIRRETVDLSLIETGNHVQFVWNGPTPTSLQ